MVVMNDVAEKCVELIQDYNNFLTKHEIEKQFVSSTLGKCDVFYFCSS